MIGKDSTRLAAVRFSLSYVFASYAFIGGLAVFDGVETNELSSLSFWLPIALAPLAVIFLILFGGGVAIEIGATSSTLLCLSLLIGLWALSFLLLRRARGRICRVIHRLAGARDASLGTADLLREYRRPSATGLGRRPD